MHIGPTFSAKEIDEFLRADGYEPNTYDYYNVKCARYMPLDVNGDRWAERDDWNPDHPQFVPKTNERFDVA